MQLVYHTVLGDIPGWGRGVKYQIYSTIFPTIKCKHRVNWGSPVFSNEEQVKGAWDDRSMGTKASVNPEQACRVVLCAPHATGSPHRVPSQGHVWAQPEGML